MNYLKPILFVSILVLLLMVNSFIFSPKNNTAESGYHNMRANAYLAEPQNTIDVLFIGDSLTYSNFMPLKIYKDFGFTSWNLGTASQRTYSTYAYLCNFLKYQKPKVVVFEVENLFLNFNASYAFYSELGRYFEFFNYHDRWKTLKYNDFTDSIEYTHTEPEKGYYDVKKKVKGKNKKYMFKNNKYASIDSGNVYFIKKCVNLLNRKGIDYIFVSTVSMKNMNYEKHNTIQKIAKQINATYLDLNVVNELSINWENDSYDGSEHLNYYGALKVSSYIGQYLASRYKLPDHRNDSKYQDWNDSVNKQF